MKDMLEEFLLIHAPSGYEAPLRAVLLEKIENMGETTVDNMGNLILSIGEGKPHLAILAHMDELGFVISNIEKSGFLRFKKIGGIDDRMLPGSEIVLLGQYGPVKGVIGIKPPHLIIDQADTKKTTPSDDLYIDVGAKNDEDTRAMGISITTVGVFEKRLREMAHNIVSSRALDNRYGVTALYEIACSIKDLSLIHI